MKKWGKSLLALALAVSMVAPNASVMSVQAVNQQEANAEQVINVTADYDNLSFTIQGMGSVALRVNQREPNKFIQLVPEGKVPFQFALNIYIRGGEQSECYFEIDAKLNPLMQMMASRPLQNLVNMMAEKIYSL